MKKVSKYIELGFDLAYLSVALILSIFMLLNKQYIFFVMALILVFGDSFHLIPRISMIKEFLFGNKDISDMSDKDRDKYLSRKYEFSLGLGKQVSSISMTVFYIFLYLGLDLINMGIVYNHIFYFLAIIRIALCFHRGNNWYKKEGSLKWGIIRNIPFVLMAVMIIIALLKSSYIAISIAVFFSFAFYLPVVLFSGKNPKVASLMLPKTICYVAILCLCLSL